MLFFVFDVPMPWGLESALNTAALIGAGLIVLLYTFQTNLIYVPQFPEGSRFMVPKPDQFGMKDYEDVTITTPDGVKIKAYAIRNREGARNQASSAFPDGTSDVTLLYLHANAGNMGHRLPVAQHIYRSFGCNVFMLSYRGYGLSEGSPNEKGIKIDSQAALDWIASHPVYSKTKIILYGQSIGGAVAIDLASRNPAKIKALIVENTFLSIRKLIPSVMPVAKYFTFLCHQVWNSEVAITKIPSTVPILLLSGQKDELIPPSHMHKLTQLARASRNKQGGSVSVDEKPAGGSRRENVTFEEFKDGMHNDTVMKPGYFEAIASFWARL